MRAAVKQTRLDFGPAPAPFAPTPEAANQSGPDLKAPRPKDAVLLVWERPGPTVQYRVHHMFGPPPHGVARVIVRGSGHPASALALRLNARTGVIGIYAPDPSPDPALARAQVLIAELDGIEISVLRDALRSLP